MRRFFLIFCLAFLVNNVSLIWAQEEVAVNAVEADSQVSDVVENMDNEQINEDEGYGANDEEYNSSEGVTNSVESLDNNVPSEPTENTEVLPADQ
jgi:hypothetical protein